MTEAGGRRSLERINRYDLIRLAELAAGVECALFARKPQSAETKTADAWELRASAHLTPGSH